MEVESDLANNRAFCENTVAGLYDSHSKLESAMAVFKDNLEQVIVASNGTTAGLVKRDRQLDLDFNALDGRITRARSILNDLNEKVRGGRDFNLRSTDPCGLDHFHKFRLASPRRMSMSIGIVKVQLRRS